MNERGGVNLQTVLAVVFGLGLAASAYLNVSQHQAAQQDKKLLQGEISDLRYQVKQDLASQSPEPSTTPSPLATPEASAAPSPSPTPAVLDASAPKIGTIKNSKNVHAGPSVGSKVILPYTSLPKGTPVTLGEVSGAWQQISVKGVTGYILITDLN